MMDFESTGLPALLTTKPITLFHSLAESVPSGRVVETSDIHTFT